MRNRGRITAVAVLLTSLAFALDRPPQEGSRQAAAYSSDESGENESYLGIDSRDITPDRLGPLGLKEERGVEVTTVDQDAPAGKAGIKEHDVILTVNGTQVESVEQLRRMIHEIPSGRVVTFGLLRNEQPVTVKAQLTDRRRANGYEYAYGPDATNFKFVMPEIHIPEMPEIRVPDIDIPAPVVVHSSLRSGLMIENLTPQLGDFFGVKNGQGVLVRSVEKGSRAEKAGLRAGDVIVRVNGQPIGDAGDFSHALRSRKGDSANLDILRDKKGQTITLTLPEHWRTGEVRYRHSIELPEVNAETGTAIEQVEAEIAQLQPELTKVRLQVNQMRPQLVQARTVLRQRQDELRKEVRQPQKQLQVRRFRRQEADI